MDAFTTHTGIVAPLDRANVDTDAIIPKQFLRLVKRDGFGKHLFCDWRFIDGDPSRENPDFVLNKPQYKGATVLLTRDNFGCGSSREHAPWALADYGFKVIIASSFAEIFYSNCTKNGIVPVVLKPDEVEQLFLKVNAVNEAKITIDLNTQSVTSPNGTVYQFKINSFAKDCLLKGLDSIAWSEQFIDKIKEYEKSTSLKRPWLF